MVVCDNRTILGKSASNPVVLLDFSTTRTSIPEDIGLGTNILLYRDMRVLFLGTPIFLLGANRTPGDSVEGHWLKVAPILSRHPRVLLI